MYGRYAVDILKRESFWSQQMILCPSISMEKIGMRRKQIIRWKVNNIKVYITLVKQL